MEKRASAAGQTRRKILEASLALHSAKGVKATSWNDIAERAGVSVGTVYYHFPTVDDLVPACSGFGMELAPPPSSEIFKGLRSKKQRIEKLVRALFEFYETHRDPLLHTLHERSSIPALQRFTDELFGRFDDLLREAFGAGAGKECLAKAGAVIDFRVFEALRDRKLSREVMVSTITRWLYELSPAGERNDHQPKRTRRSTHARATNHT